MSLGLDHRIEIATPFLEWEKEDVIKRGVELNVPLELTLSCMNPVAGQTGEAGESGETGETGESGETGALPQHCGLCSKCRERRDAFAAAGVSDPSRYANKPPR
jgi:7-cyano-7-deazaguanine synthase